MINDLITNCFIFLSDFSYAYISLNAFKMLEQFEAAEYLNSRNKIFMRGLKLALLVLGLTIIAPVPVVVICTIGYLPHFIALWSYDESCDQQQYNLTIKNFWRKYLRALILAIIAYTIVPSLLSPVIILETSKILSLIAVTFPFCMSDIKKFIAPLTPATKFLHEFETILREWSSFLTLLQPSSSLFSRLISYTAIIASLSPALMKFIHYCVFNLISLRFISAMRYFFCSKYMPSLIRDTYQMFYEEFQAYDDYHRRPPMSLLTIKEQIVENTISNLAPAVENLFLYQQEPVFLNQASSAEASDKARKVLSTILGSEEHFKELLKACGNYMPYWKKLLKNLENDYFENEALVILRQAIINPQPELQKNPKVAEFVTTFNGAFDNIFALINNPTIQAASRSENNNFIIQGIAALCDKYLLQEQNRGGSLESLQYQHNLIARIIHKTNLCQQGLITLIEEELRPQSSSSPLRTSWTSYMIEEIKRDDKRCYDSFIKLHNTIDIERKMFETIIFESENVDYQEFILKSYLPKGDPENILSALPYLIINRHRPPFLEWFGSFTDYILGQSYHPIDHAMPLIVSPASVQHSVIYPSLFSAESVEEMIERTQQLYLESITELESPIELWGKNCQSLWQSYLNEAYPYDQHEIDNNPIKEEHESETLAQAYKELIQSVKGMYSSDLRLEIRQSIAQRANNMFGKNTISFLKNKVTEQGEKIPTTFDSWSERKQRDYFHLNKPAVREDDINPNIIFTGSTKPQYFVSREFALVILLSEGIITSRHPFHEKITKVTKLPSCHYTQKVLDLCGYNSR